MISVLVPCFNEKDAISILSDAIQQAFESIESDWELLIVDDGSTDGTEKKMEENLTLSTWLKYIKLPYNMGQYEAIKFGIPYCQGEWIVVMDADGQDDPLVISRLYEKALSGDFDAVFAERFDKKYSILKVLSSKLFHRILGLITGKKQNHRIAGFGIYKREVLMELGSRPSPFLYLPLMKQWQPYRTSTHPVEHQPRITGKSSYSLRKQVGLALKIFRSLDQKKN